MSYLLCRFQYGQFHVRSVSNTSGIVDQLSDFETGNLTISNRYDYEDFSGFTDGTTLTSAAVTDDTVLTVGSTSGMTATDRVFIELDIGTFHGTTIASVDSGTQITINNGLSSGAAIGNTVVILSQLSGSTTGTITQDFKAEKVKAIFHRSVVLEEEGFVFDSRDFYLGVKDGADDHRWRSDYTRLIGLRGILPDMNGEATLDFDLKPYIFSSNTNFDNFYTAYRNRELAIYGGGTGQSGLINQVTAAANSQAAMDAIIDNRA